MLEKEKGSGGEERKKDIRGDNEWRGEEEDGTERKGMMEETGAGGITGVVVREESKGERERKKDESKDKVEE